MSVLGTTVAIRGPHGLLAELAPALVDMTDEAAPARALDLVPGPGGTLELLDDGRRVLADVAPVVAAATAVWWCNTIAAGTDHLVIHAAAVGGTRAVLLPGPSGAGKSTVAAACVRAGMSYLSDEYGVLDTERGVLLPYPKPLSLDGEVLVASSQLRAGSRGGQLAPGAILFPRYDPRQPPARTRLAPAAALLLLVANTLDVAGHGGRALAWLAGLAQSCPAWEHVYGDTTAVAEHACELGAGPAAGGPARGGHRAGDALDRDGGAG